MICESEILLFRGARMELIKYGAIYLRLSRDDNNRNESESIANQRRLLMQYAAVNQIPVRYEFLDDGITGTTQNRKGLQQMFQAIEDGRIDTVLVKDLSRLSRNYIHTGTLIEEWFPAHGIRLISVDDGIDTARSSASNDLFAIRAVIDDWYARDISRKVRAAIYAKQNAGFCTAAHLPFGYEKREDAICVQNQHAQIIKSIFQQYCSGASICKIAGRLRAVKESERKWSDTAVRRILNNPAYIGNLYLHTSEKASYKCNRRIPVPYEKAILYPVPRIISDELFYEVKDKLSDKRRRREPPHWLTGKVFCACCGAKMHISGTEGGRIICSTRKRFQTCRAPSILRKELLDNISEVLRQDGIPFQDSLCRRIIHTIRISPDCITICVTYKKRENMTNTVDSGVICE